MSDDVNLLAHMEWLYGKGGVYQGDGEKQCLCEHAYGNLGRLYGMSMGKGWVRTTTHPDCPFHVSGSRLRARSGGRQ